MNTEMSLVLWSPSTLMTLKLLSIASCHCGSGERVSTASVVMNESVVACCAFIDGEIMPEPLAMPATVTTVPSLRVTCMAASLITLSVVRMAWAAR